MTHWSNSSSLGRAIHYTPHALFSVIAIASLIAINEATYWFNRTTLVAISVVDSFQKKLASPFSLNIKLTSPFYAL